MMKRRDMVVLSGGTLLGGCLNSREKDSWKTLSNRGKCAGCTDQWTQFNYDSQNTGYNSNTSIPDSIRVAWKVNVSRFNITASPAISRKNVYIPAGHELYVINRGDGTVVGKKKIQYVGMSSPAISGGIVITGGDGVKAIQRSSGEVSWKNKTKYDVMASPLVTNDSVYIGEATETGRSQNSPKLFSIDIKTGEIEWSVSRYPGFRAGAAVKRGKVMVPADSDLLAIDSETGEIEWTFSTDPGFNTAPAIQQDIVYTNTPSDTLYAINIEDGTEEWTFEANADTNTPPTVAEDSVLFSSGNIMYSIDSRSGKQKWQFETNSPIFSPASVANSKLCFGTQYGNLYALDSETGELIWKFKPQSEHSSKDGNVNYGIQGGPALVDQTIVFGDEDGYVYALEADDN